MRLNFIVLLLCISGWAVHAQEYTESFFPGMSFVHEMDSVSLTEFKEIIKKYPADFNQPLFTYGSDDPSEWEMITKAIEEYPEIVIPKITRVDFNKDGKPDLILSFTAGQEYSFVAFYIADKKGYLNVYTERGQFYGIYENGDLCYLKPACCDDPTHEFHRLKVVKKRSLVNDNMLSITTFHLNYFPKPEELFIQDVWTVSPDTLYPVANSERYGAFIPGAKIRQISEAVIEGEKLVFCEIIGELDSDISTDIFPHAFAWLSDQPKHSK